MGRPIEEVAWATDDDYTNPPQAGTPTKVEPNAGKRAEGWRPSERPAAQHQNHVLNAHGKTLEYTRDIPWLNLIPINATDFSNSAFNQGRIKAMGVRPGLTPPFADGAFLAMTNHVTVANPNFLFSRDGFSWAICGSYVEGADHPRAVFWWGEAGVWLAGGNASDTPELLQGDHANEIGEITPNDPGIDFDRNCFAGNSVLAVCARSGGGFITSDIGTLGTTWVERTHPATEKNIRAVLWVESISLFIACGYNGTILTSPDGITWTQRTSALGTHLEDLAFDPATGRVLISGDLGAVQTSPDGIAWTSRPALTVAGGVYVVNVISDGIGTIFATDVHPTNILWRSLDGGDSWEGKEIAGLAETYGCVFAYGRLLVFGKSIVGPNARPGVMVGLAAG